MVLSCIHLHTQKNLGVHESDPSEAMKLLSSTRGTLVPMPLNFLRDEHTLLPEFGTVEYIAPDTIFKWTPYTLCGFCEIFFHVYSIIFLEGIAVYTLVILMGIISKLLCKSPSDHITDSYTQLDVLSGKQQYYSMWHSTILINITCYRLCIRPILGYINYKSHTNPKCMVIRQKCLN